MSPERMVVRNIQQKMENPRGPEVNLGRFYLAFADIPMPRLKFSEQECTGQDIEVRPNGFVRDTHGSGLSEVQLERG